MTLLNDRNRSPKLQANVVEALLISCIRGCSLNEMMIKMDDPSISIIKIYLFYLIDYCIISYDGENQLYTTEAEGFELLCHIYKEKIVANVDSKDIMIFIE